jgi:hypothetical protein
MLSRSIAVLLLLFVSSNAMAIDMIGLSDDSKQIVVNNRILAKVNGTPISVFDLMKKMDVVFYREYPEYSSSKMARYQFYMANWKVVLQDQINKELINADAEDNKLVVSNGDVRQEMESTFGPNIIANLDKIGMTMDEAWKIVKGDIVLRRMMMIRVNSNALRQVGPLEVRKAYDKYAQENLKLDEWHYYVISVRDKDAEKGSRVAKRIEELIKDNPTLSFPEMAEMVRALPNVDSSIAVNVSEELVHNDLQLSPAYKMVLTSMEPETYTEALPQKSRADNKMVYRIFYLKEKVAGGLPDFAEVELELRDRLLNEAVEKESALYIKRLQKHYGVSENMVKEIIAGDFQPFSLQ